MMNKLTGNLRNTQPSEHLPGLQQAGSRCSVRAGPPMPGTPQQRAGAACQPPQPSQPSVELDHAPSMALIPSSRSLAVPASLTDEALPTLQPLPGVHAFPQTTVRVLSPPRWIACIAGAVCGQGHAHRVCW